MKIILERVSNGVLFTEDDGESESRRFVYQTEDDEGTTQYSAVQGLLYDVLTRIGYSGGRHDKERIYIEVKPGDKYEEAVNG